MTARLEKLEAERNWWLERLAILDDEEVSYRGRRLVVRYFGLEDGQIKTLKEAGDLFEIGVERTRQLINQAKRKVLQIEKTLEEVEAAKRFKQPTVHNAPVEVLGRKPPYFNGQGRLAGSILVRSANYEWCVQLGDIHEKEQ